MPLRRPQHFFNTLLDWEMQSAMRRVLKRLASAPLILLAAFWLFVEEWLWDKLAAFMAYLSRLPSVRALEARIELLPPYAAMSLFLVPVALMLPFNIVGIWFVARGDAALGAGIFIAAKVTGTAIVAWIFVHSRKALLTVAWFSAVHRAYLRFRDYVHARLAELAVWRKARALAQEARQWISRLKNGALRRRWLAIRRLRARRSKAPS